MTYEMPICSKCGHRHWRFKPCGAQRIQNLPEGWRPWGDRTHTYDQTAPGVFSLKSKRTYKSHGRVTPPTEG